MRKRVFGSIFLTSLVTLLLTTGLLLLAVHAGLTNDMRQRLVTESSYLSAVDNIGEELEKFGSVYADRLTLVAQDGTVLYDNRTNASEMENHAVRPEIAAAEKNGTGEDNRLSETFAKQTFYYAVRLKNGDVLRISATADSVFGALSNASPWIVLIILLALLVAALLAGWLTGRIRRESVGRLMDAIAFGAPLAIAVERIGEGCFDEIMGMGKGIETEWLAFLGNLTGGNHPVFLYEAAAMVVLFAVVPFNLLKGVIVSALTFLLYKRISPILHKNDEKMLKRREKRASAADSSAKS